jgi:hypothetical protein
MMILAFWLKMRYNKHMKTKYTPQQMKRFFRFCDRHGLAFANIAEYKRIWLAHGSRPSGSVRKHFSDFVQQIVEASNAK